MIDACTGTLIDRGHDPLTQQAYALVLLPSGLTYRILTGEHCLPKLPANGEPVQLYTHFVVREDSQQLIGFLSKVERDVFSLLLSASGVGAKVALALLDALAVPELVEAIMSGQHKVLTAAKGVGPKLAQKVVLELKEKLTTWQKAQPGLAVTTTEGQVIDWPFTETVKDEAEGVLLSLGYSEAEVVQSLTGVTKTDGYDWSTESSEVVLREALRWLACHV